MTAVHEQGQPDTYQWRTAPAHLKTRRQLRAAGLSPGGQDVAALMLGKRRGRRLIAHLYDITLARPKRVPSPAQLEAIAKATRAHQARAAERHGYDRAELATPTDPGPGWVDQENTASLTPLGDTMNQHDRDTAIGTELIDVENEMAVGHGQRVAYLHALVAVNQARERRERYIIDMDAAERHGQEAADAVAERIGVALELDEQALSIDVGANRDAMAGHLAKALTWMEASPVAATRAEEITTMLAAEWGVLVDVDELSVRIEEAFDAHGAQVAAEARAVRIREVAMLDAVAAFTLPAEVKAAVGEVMAAWSEQYFESDQAQVYIDSEPYRYRDLLTELGKVPMPEADRAAVEFTLDYLRDSVDGVDLLDTPVMVDPGEEARGRVPALLEYFAHGEIAAGEIAEEISVMTTADQDAARAVGRDIAADREYDTQVWPGYADRDHIREELWSYARDAGKQRGEADYLVDEATGSAGKSTEMFGISDAAGERVERTAARREQLHAVAENGKGLTVAERRQITATLADIDAGRIADETQLPELMWLDERTKSEVDLVRGYQPAVRLSNQTETEVTELIEAGGGVDKGSHTAQIVDGAVAGVGGSIYSVAGGAPLGVEYERKLFAERCDHLGQALAEAGVDRDTKLAVRKVIGTAAHEAGRLGRPAAQRHTRWKARTDQAITHRDDQAAQRRAAANQRAPRTSGRNCATRADRAAQAASPAPARHTMRRTGPEVQR